MIQVVSRKVVKAMSERSHREKETRGRRDRYMLFGRTAESTRPPASIEFINSSSRASFHTLGTLVRSI